MDERLASDTLGCEECARNAWTMWLPRNHGLPSRVHGAAIWIFAPCSILRERWLEVSNRNRKLESKKLSGSEFHILYVEMSNINYAGFPCMTAAQLQQSLHGYANCPCRV